MSKLSKICKWSVVTAMAAVLAVGAVSADAVQASAAKKVKSIKVTASNSILGSSKTLYVKGPKNVKSTKLKVTVKPAKASKKVTYKSSNKKVAAVSKSGKVTAKKAGKTTITVTSKSNKKVKKKVKITVKKYVYPTSMSVTASKTSLAVGETGTVKATVKPAKASVKKVTYSSSDASVAAVSTKGVVTAKKAGTANITVKAVSKTKAKKTLSKTIAITVKGTGTSNPGTANQPEPTSIKLSSESYNLTKTGVNPNPTVTLEPELAPANAATAITWSSSDPTVATVDSKGLVTAQTTGKTVITATTKNGKTAACNIKVSKTTVPVHDPSIFKDPNSDKYYTIGTEVAMAVSSDLQAWTQTTSGTRLFKNGIDELKPLFDYTGKTDITSVWAADLIYNTSMKKYCMYTCAAASGFKTVIGMFSSDSPTGPYEYQGIIVCADFNKTTLDKTNIVSALGLSDASEVPASYYDASETGTAGSAYYKEHFPDAIDPAPFYGHDGNLYLTYGSFTCYGGIRVLKLDPDTGLRSAKYNYEMKEGVSDPYFGKQITNKAGEGPYILKVPTEKSPTGYYYYLFTSSGLLRHSGNYTMSMWRSENPDGPFVDAAGTDATAGGGNVVMYNYKYSFMKYAHTSMGGNSGFVDTDGKVYVVFHNKFSDTSPAPGTHRVKIHQMFVNDDGWLVTSPFEYHSETIAASYDKADVAGNYEFVMHRQSTATYVGDFNYNISVPLRLNADGTVTGDYEGTWKLSGNKITVTIGDVDYKGVVLEQYEDDGGNGNVSSCDKTIVFTALGSNRVNITGTKVTMTDDEATELDVSNISIPAKTDKDFTVPVMGVGGSDITWASDNTDAIRVDGRNAAVTCLDADANVTLTATVKRGGKTVTKTFKVLVPAYEIVLPTSITQNMTLTLPEKSIQGNAITWSSSDENVINPETGAVTVPDNSIVKVTLTAKYGTVERTFEIRVGELTLSNLVSQDYETAGITAQAAGWTTHGALTSEIITEAGNSYAKFTSTGSGPRSGLQNLGVTASELTPTYVVSTDFAVTTATYSGSGQPTTQVALVSQSNALSGSTNVIADSECIVDLQAVGMSADTFTINGNEEEKVTIPAGTWCHMEATVDQTQKSVFIKITDADDNELYSGTLPIAGDTQIKGIYTLNGRGGTVTQFDNTAVKVTQ